MLTLVFDIDVESVKGNPFHIETPYGLPVAIGKGNAFDQIEEETVGTEWFWRIVDAAGLADLPSDEEAALRLILRRGGYSAALRSAIDRYDASVSDGSREAGKTEGLDPKDDSATRESGGRP